MTFDRGTGIIWGSGETAEKSNKNAKYDSYADDNEGVGYEFTCWCSDLETVPCSQDLYETIVEQGRLGIEFEMKEGTAELVPS